MSEACDYCDRPSIEITPEIFGLCENCRDRKATENKRQLKAKEGPFYEWWREGYNLWARLHGLKEV